MQKHATFLGYSGLIPFITLPFFIVTDVISYYEGMSLFNYYSAIILSFLGGTFWIDNINRTGKVSDLYVATLPSIIGFASIALLSAAVAMWVTLLMFIGVLVYELNKLDTALWYKRLRINLSSVVCVCHLMMLWLIYHGI